MSPTRLVDNPGLVGRVRRQWPWVLLVAIVAVGIAFIAVGHWRRGSVIVGGALLVGGFFRLVLPDPGILAIRAHRWLDVLMYLGLGAAIVVIAVVVPAV